MAKSAKKLDAEGLERLRIHFPVTDNLIYMNHAGIGPLSRDMASAMCKRAMEVSEGGGRCELVDEADACRGMYAEMIGARPEEIAFVDTTTRGVNIVANGLSFVAGDNVVCADMEYPANVYPWWRQKELGVELRMVKGKGGKLLVEDVMEAVDAKTKVVALSLVEFVNGFRNDVAKISEECRKRGVRFFVDAIQGVGAIRVNVEEMGMDYLAAGSEKWLLCPGGKGVLYIRKERLEELRVTTVGAASVINAEDYLNYDLTYVAGARRFEGSGFDPVGFAGTHAMLAMFKGLGMDFITERVESLTDRLCEGLLKKGFTVDSHRGKGEKSGIVTFHHEKTASETLSQRLQDANVIHTHRYGMIRLSPHFYNSEAEINEAIKAL